MTGTGGTEEFAAYLRRLKDRSGRSYGALAARLHLSASSLHRYCSGEAVPPDYAPAERLARLCEATPEELVRLHRLWLRADAERTAARAAGAAPGSGGRERSEARPVSAAGRGAPAPAPAPAHGRSTAGTTGGAPGPGDAPADDGAATDTGPASDAGVPGARPACGSDRAPGTGPNADTGPAPEPGPASGPGTRAGTGTGTGEAPADDTPLARSPRPAGGSGPGPVRGARSHGSGRVAGAAPPRGPSPFRALVRRRTAAALAAACVTALAVTALVVTAGEGARGGGRSAEAVAPGFSWEPGVRTGAPPDTAVPSASTGPRGKPGRRGSASPGPSAAPGPGGGDGGPGSGRDGGRADGGRDTGHGPGGGAVPLTVATRSHVWANGCDHRYLLDRPPSGVPAPPVEQDAAAWAGRLGAVHGGRTDVETTVQGTSADAVVVLRALRVRVVGRAAPLAWPVYAMDNGCGGSLTPAAFSVNLDAERPLARPTDGFDGDSGRELPAVRLPFTVSPKDPLVLRVTARTGGCDCRWYLELDWTSGGREGTVRINDGGDPFRTSGIEGRPLYGYWLDPRGWRLADHG
ncbi:helix-turn-helix transcriptional regulator [Streptomyces albus]|uniref:transcriptional regulator n=1 Tax=Streptomyces albus TaxID=1888 RepID=UPI00068A45C3|nr:helix-turn-helix transcriptional regulator [Streptomyces albus]